MIERINLIPDEIREKKSKGQRRLLVIAFLILSVLGMGMVYFYQRGKIHGRLDRIEQASKERDELIVQNARYKEVIERINQTQKREEDIKKRVEVIGSLLEGRIYWSEILRSATHLVPGGIWLTSLATYDVSDQNKTPAPRPGKGVKMNGTALTNSMIAEFVFALENSQFFGNVLLTYSQKREFQGKDLYDFEITTDLKRIK